MFRIAKIYSDIGKSASKIDVLPRLNGCLLAATTSGQENAIETNFQICALLVILPDVRE
jgi:hypothetical protein